MCRRNPRALVRLVIVFALAGRAGEVFAADVPVITPKGASAATAPKAEVVDDSWQVMYFGDQRIGYSHSTTTSRKESSTRTILTTTAESHLQIRRFGQPLKLSQRMIIEETERDQLRRLTHVLENPPATAVTTTGRVEEDRLMLEITTAGRKEPKGVPWDPLVKSSVYMERDFKTAPLQPSEVRKYQVFLPELQRIVDQRIAADQPRPTKLRDGKSYNLLMVTITQTGLPTPVRIKAYLDTRGIVQKSEMDFLGEQLITYAATKEDALSAIAGEELDLAVSTLVRVTRLAKGHGSKSAVYHVTVRGEDPREFLVNDDIQSVKPLKPEQVEVTVTSVPLPQTAKLSEGMAEYLASTQYLQSADPRVVEHARRASAGVNDSAQIARRMEAYVHQRLTKKNFSTALASAAEVAETMQGDCTEHAVLLAAMLRGAKIPSRIVVGLVYIEKDQAFGGHMWTEAWIGEKWVPLDATIGRGGIGAGHIKLAQSSFSDQDANPITMFLPLMNILGKVQIDIVSAE